MSQNVSQLEAVDGYWLSFDDDEKAVVKATLLQDGYTPDHDGLKRWILDTCESDTEEDFDDSTARLRQRASAYHQQRRERSRGILDTLYELGRNNPEQVAKAAQFLSAYLQRARR